MTDALTLATRLLKAHDAGATIERLSDTEAPFDVAAGYRVQAALIAARKVRGEKPIGWKIGYTNRAVQQQYGVLHPIWGPMYDTTVTEVAGGETATCSLSNLAEPRIEPEIVVRIGRVPQPGMSLTELVGCIDAVGHGFGW
jgi:2-oxo-3-hexenedioate decarboxylase